MTTSHFDVAIIGAGPGGSATALSLRSCAPTLSVVLIESSHYEVQRIGETLPPAARSLLLHLGVWKAFHDQRHKEVHGTTSAWGRAATVDSDFIFMPNGPGWHIERARFDEMLSREAAKNGAALMLDTRVRDARRAGNEWRVTLSNGDTVASRFLVDATGGNASIARRFDARFVEVDNLTGIAAFFECNTGDPRTMVDAFEDGWWYTAGLPEGRRIVVCMTDADIARRMRLYDEKIWQAKLDERPNIGAMKFQDSRCSSLVARSAASRRLEPVAGEDWLAVGDSASRFDPLSSQGIVKAMRSGIFASYAIADLLTRDDVLGMHRYRQYVIEEFKSYLDVRAKYYREETRWPTSEFWRRRHGELILPVMNQPVVGKLAEQTN